MAALLKEQSDYMAALQHCYADRRIGIRRTGWLALRTYAWVQDIAVNGVHQGTSS